MTSDSLVENLVLEEMRLLWPSSSKDSVVKTPSDDMVAIPEA
jgi:hypothetical protein